VAGSTSLSYNALLAESISLAEHHIYGAQRLGIQYYDQNAGGALTPQLNGLRSKWTYGNSSASGTFYNLSDKQAVWWSYVMGDLLMKVDKREKNGYRESWGNLSGVTGSGSVDGAGRLTSQSYFNVRRTLGWRQYELSDHLGNVLASVLDRKRGSAAYHTDGSGASVYDYFTADVASAQDYYPFGMLMPGRQFVLAGMDGRFGFNGQQKDDEIGGAGNSLEFKFRSYDPRLARFKSIDPLNSQYPYFNPYQFAGNRPIDCIDFEGKEPIKAGLATDVFVTNHGTSVKVVSNLTIKVQILNLSSKSDASINMSQVRGYVGQFGQSLSGSHTATITSGFMLDGKTKQPKMINGSAATTDATYQTQLSLETEVIHSIGEISNDAVVMGIVDDINPKGGELAIGSTEAASLLIPAYSLTNDNVASLGAKLISHELGHVFGLGHNSSGSMKTGDAKNQIGFSEKEKVEMMRNLIGNWYDLWNNIKSNPRKSDNLRLEIDMKKSFQNLKDER